MDRASKTDDHIDRLIEAWRREQPEYKLDPVAVIGRMARVMEYVDRGIEMKFAEYGLSRASFDVLATLKRSGPPYRLSQRRLMETLLRTSGSISIRIDALERAGYVVRELDPEDRRGVLVAITHQGAELLKKVIPEHLRNEDRLLAPLTAQERKTLRLLLHKWLVWFEAQHDDTPPGPLRR